MLTCRLTIKIKDYFPKTDSIPYSNYICLFSCGEYQGQIPFLPDESKYLQHQLKNNIVNNPYDTDMSYKKILDIISKFENVRNVKKLVEKPRLSIFKEITGDIQEDNIKSRLLDDIKQLDDILE